MKTELLLKRLSLVGAACAALSLAPAAQSHVLGSTNLFGDTVTISYNGNQTVGAGAFQGATWDGLPIPDFWCIDLDHHVSLPFFYPDYTAALFESPPLTFSATEVSNLRTLFANQLSNAETSADSAAAFQVAIWDILFDNDGSLSSADPNGGVGPGSGFGLVSAPGSVAATAQGWINAAEDINNQHPFSLVQLTNTSDPQRQSFIAPNLTPVLLNAPEPTGLALLGAALVAMMFVMRRRGTGMQSAA